MSSLAERIVAFFRKGRNVVDAGSKLAGTLRKLEKDPDNEQLKGELDTEIEELLNLDPGTLSEVFAEPTESFKQDLGKTHQTWENQTASQVVQPLQYCKPTSLLELTAILNEAIGKGLQVKAAGSGHSYSDVATTPDLFVDTHGLDHIATSDQPITGQLRQQELKMEWSDEKMRGKWQPIDDLPDINHESSMEDIMKVRNVFQGNTALFETEAGITIHQLNKALEKANLGLPNMGGYDGQTIVGAISTSTHGTGINLPPFPDMMRSLVLATTGTWDGKVVSGSGCSGPINYYRIEPSNGITDPQLYSQAQDQYTTEDGSQIQLIQDDDCFHAVMVNMGTMGVIYSIVLEVMQFYYLTETRRLSTLDQTLALIQADPNNPNGVPAVMQRFRHFEFLVSPYPVDKHGHVIHMDPNEPPETYYPSFHTLHFEMNITPRKQSNFKPGTTPRNWISAVFGKLRISFKLLAFLANHCPKIVPRLVHEGMDSLVDENYVAKSYNIYNLGVDGDAGFANEIGFPVQAPSNSQFTPEHLVSAINSIHRVAQTARLQGAQYQTSPFAVRFVRRSSAFLSMMNGTDTAMIELDMITGTYGGQEIVNRQQKSLYQHGGRPHWGLEFDQLTGSNGLVQRLYPEFDKWKHVYDQLNSCGTFDNKTTIRLGFSELPYVRKG